MNLKYILRTLSFIWHRGKLWIILSVVFSIITGLIPITSVWIMKELVNTVAELIQMESNEYTIAFLLLLFLFIVMIVGSVIQSVKEYLDNKMSIKLNHDLKQMIISKTTAVPYSYFDIPAFLNHLDRINRSPGSRFLAPVKNILIIFESIISISSLLFFLINIHWSLVILSIMVAFPTFFVQAIYGGKKFKLVVKQTPIAREVNYLEYILNNPQPAKEIRLYNLSSYLKLRWSKRFMKNSKEQLQLLKKENTAEIILDGLTALLYCSSAAIIIWLIKTKNIQIGQFVAIGQAVQGTQSAINSISTTLAKMYEDNLYVNDLFSFLDFKVDSIAEVQQVSKFPLPIKKGIELQNLSYRFPYGKEDTIKNINLYIEPGEKVAIVGENGSGKTTLIKCLIGLYSPTEGNVILNGVNIKDINREDLYKHITAIFQDFMKYSFTVQDNIGFGNVEKIDYIDDIKNAAKNNGVDSFVNHFKDGYETYLGRFLKKGEELSEGQWQKIALSRAYFSGGSIMVLDEPTASLDPKAELKVFEQFKDITSNKTTIFISHRMAAAKLADRIIVMSDGKIVESGTHHNLIQKRGEYWNMYNMQANWYTPEN